MSWAQPPGQPPPGWYPDPGGSGRQRWWDGTRWTEHYAGGPQPAVQPPGYVQQPPTGYAQGAGQGPQPGYVQQPPPAYAQPPFARGAKDTTPPPVFWAAPVAAVLLIAGSIGTWATVEVSAFGSGFSQSVGGLDDGGDGWLTLLAAVIAGALLVIWVFERNVILPIVAAVIAAVASIVALYHAADPATGNDVPDILEVRAGWGVWVALVSSLVLLGTAIVLALQTGRRGG